eukprot:7073409-Pyramimonas_sp.AAC.1
MQNSMATKGDARILHRSFEEHAQKIAIPHAPHGRDRFPRTTMNIAIDTMLQASIANIEKTNVSFPAPHALSARPAAPSKPEWFS